MSTNDHEERHGEHAEQTKVYVRHEYCVLCAFYVETHVKISINTFRRINAADTRHTRRTFKNTHTMLNAHISYMNLSIRQNEQKNKWNNYHMLLLRFTFQHLVASSIQH